MVNEVTGQILPLLEDYIFGAMCFSNTLAICTTDRGASQGRVSTSNISGKITSE
jgi:hypothetical protein